MRSIYAYIHIYIYIHMNLCNRRLGWGGESNREVVSLRLRMRTRGLVVEWNFASNVRAVLSLFVFCTGAFPFSLVRVQGVLVSSSEFK